MDQESRSPAFLPVVSEDHLAASSSNYPASLNPLHLPVLTVETEVKCSGGLSKVAVLHGGTVLCEGSAILSSNRRF